MRKVAVIQRNETKEAEYVLNRDKAGEYFAKNAAGNFILMEIWAREFNTMSFQKKLAILTDVIEEADVVYLVPGWLQDPMCRILHEVAVMLKKTIIEGES